MSTVILGKEIDTPCYVAHARDRQKSLRFVYERLLHRKTDDELLTLVCGQTDRGKDDVDDILTFDDGLQVVADRCKRLLGLDHRDLDVLVALSDKAQFKRLPSLSAYIIPYFEVGLTANSSAVDGQIRESFGYPVVVKPSNAFYSAGVVRANTIEELPNALSVARATARLMRVSRGSSSLLVEKYVEGEECAVDGFIYDGKVYCLQFHEKWPSLVGPRFHEEAYITQSSSSNSPAVLQACAFAEKVVTASGLDHSPFHLEIRWDENGKRAYVLEIAARLSGGGTTTQQLSLITTGLDCYGLLEAVNQRTFSAAAFPCRALAMGLEVDFSVPEAGTLRGLEDTRRICEFHQARSIFQFKSDGDFMAKSGESVEACLIAYFAVQDRDSAIKTFEAIKMQSVISVRKEE